jgi:hypothetical protein
MSIFLASLAFPPGDLLVTAKAAILLAPVGTRSATSRTSTAADSSQRHVSPPARRGCRLYWANSAAGTSSEGAR